MGRRKNRSSPRQLSISLPQDTYKYLVYLAGIGKYGFNENDVATYLVIQEVHRMEKEKEHEIKSP